jgi:hypothetical protein
MSKSLWAVAVIFIVAGVLFPAANTQLTAPANRSTATNISVGVAEPLAQSVIGLLGLIVIAIFMASLISGGEF